MSRRSVRSVRWKSTVARPIGSSSAARAACASDLIRPTDPQWARDAVAECVRVGAAPFLKQWGTYKNNPFVVEHGLTEQQAMKIDPPDNGKGGGKLDGRLWRDFPDRRIASEISDGRAREGRRIWLRETQSDIRRAMTG